jgi:hypothetical protein
MRTQARVLISITFTFTVLLAAAVPASADNARWDGDDSSTMDLARVASATQGASVRFSARFHDPIDWTKRPVVGFHLDARGGRGFDRDIFIQHRGGHPICRVYTQHRFVGKMQPPKVTEDSMSCRVKRRMLGSNGSPVRWNASAIYLEDISDEADYAPDAGVIVHI